MALNYAEQKLAEALKQTGGNQAQARQLIIEWCAQDHRLLHMVTRPHMTGIVAHALQRVMKQKSGASSVSSTVKPKADPGGKDELFGKEMLKNFAMGKPTKFAEEGFGAPLKKTKASKAHIDAIRMIAQKKNKPF